MVPTGNGRDCLKEVEHVPFSTPVAVCPLCPEPSSLLVAALGLPNVSFGQSVAAKVATSVGADPLAVGRILSHPQTLQYDRIGLINKVAGQPSEAAIVKYGGDMEAYWQAAKRSRMGKSFEAVLAYTKNRASPQPVPSSAFSSRPPRTCRIMVPISS